MNGVNIKKAEIVSEDDRRSILEIFNGEFNVKQIKILTAKKGEEVLGNHWHTYGEIRYLMKGKCEYKIKHVITGETKEFILNEGEIFSTTGFIIHTCKFLEDGIMIDGSEQPYISKDFNCIEEKIW